MSPQPCLHNCTCYSSPWKRANIFDCQQKGLKSLPKTVLQDTDWLFLSGNNLGSLNEAPDYLKNISLLDISSSKIEEIDETVMEVIMHNVKSLDIRSNKLKTLPKSITKRNETNKLWISDNPYECNCDMIWMKDWLMDTTSVLDKENVTCSGSKVKGEIKVYNDQQTQVTYFLIDLLIVSWHGLSVRSGQIRTRVEVKSSFRLIFKIFNNKSCKMTTKNLDNQSLNFANQI